MKKNFSEWKSENVSVKKTRAAKRETVGKPLDEFLSSKCILELMERIADASGGKGSPKQVLLQGDVAFFSKELANRLSITPLQAVLLPLVQGYLWQVTTIPRKLPGDGDPLQACLTSSVRP